MLPRMNKNGRSITAFAEPDLAPLSVLTDKQKRFCMFVAEGKSLRTALALAGYVDNGNGKEQQLIRDPKVVAAIKYLHKKYENSIVASRKKVLEGFLEAIEQAKLMSDPAVQIAGWREIGKMCGYYAPEVKEVNVNVGAKRVISQLEVMSDDQLLELIEKDTASIEGEARQIVDVPEEPTAA